MSGMSLAFRAMQFARRAHANQVRKYTGNPYTDHLAEVAGIVASVAIDRYSVLAEKMIAVAWLHDCVEDQGVNLDDLEAAFGTTVAIGVSGLTDVEKGNRAQRKAAARERLALCQSWIQTIKVADLISNTASIVKHDPQFAAVYLKEKRLLLDVLTRADPGLLSIARQQVADGLTHIANVTAAGRLSSDPPTTTEGAPQ